MKRIALTSLPLLLLIVGCGGATSPEDEQPQVSLESTKKIRALGIDFEWQTEVDSQKDWQEAQAYCAEKSMRLPSPEEFFALLDTNQSIDTLFPSEIKEFWTNKSYSDTKAWKITTWSSTQTYHDKNSTLGVRCVKGETLSNHTFTKESDTVLDTDTVTNIEKRWQDDTQAMTKRLNFIDAESYCQARDMRLPTLFELQQATEVDFNNIIRDDFLSYWTTTPLPLDTNARITLNAMTGAVLFSDKEALNHVRCVETINHAPTINSNINILTDEDTPITISLGGADSDGDTTTIIITKEPAHGSYQDGIYTPEANYYGNDTIQYKVSDGRLESPEATVSITVTPINDAPTAKDLSIITTEEVDKSFSTGMQDSDNDTLSLSIVNQPSHGELTINGSNFTYAPQVNFQGSDSFDYRVFDGSLYSESYHVTITVNNVNDAPRATNNTITLLEDSSSTLTLTATDIDNATLSYSIVKDPEHGSLTGQAPNLTYTPYSNYNGVDSFSYKVNDGTLDSNVATITLMITAKNDAPIAYNATFATMEDNDKNITLTGDDIDNTTLSYHIQNNPLHGTLIGTAPNLLYRPDTNYNGTDSFTFYLNDGSLDSAPATITINVGSSNDAPEADAKNVSGNEDAPLTISLSGSDTELSPLSYTILSQPAHGTVTLSGNIATYTPASNYAGSDSFTYRVNDGTLDSNEATVTITINEINDKPIANSTSLSTLEDVAKDIILSGSDIESTSLTYTIKSDPSKGTLSGSNNTWTYTPNPNVTGTDSFTFIVNDGTLDSEIATVSIMIDAINDAPTAMSQALESNEDENLSIVLEGSDIEGTFSYEITTAPQHGSLSGTAPNILYTPEANYFGSDSFGFKTYDGDSYSDEANVSLTIVSINDIPTVTSQDLTTREDNPLTILLEANDIESTTLTYTTSNPAHGTLSGIAPNLTYIPEENYNGEDSFNFTVSDGEANATATINLTIESVNDAPTALAGNNIVATQGDEVTLNGTATDIDGSIQSYEWREGSTILATTASFSKSDFTVGDHNLTFTVMDNDNDIGTDMLTLTINPPTEISTDFTVHTLQTGGGNDKIRWQRFADLDDDGDKDIIIVSQSGLHWYENSGNLTSFVPHLEISTLPYMEDVHISDIDGDTKLDIIFSTLTSTPNLHICRNNGDKTFSCKDINTSFSTLSMIGVADIDGDTDNDIILSSTNSDTITWIANEGDGTFTTETIISSGDLSNVISLDIVDLDKNGKIDIMAASNTDKNIYWFENLGGSFAAHFEDNSISNIQSISLSDIDGDGVLDNLVTSTTSGTILSWFKGSGTDTPSFLSPKFITTDISYINYASGIDIDKDGDIDILTNASEDNGKIVWYENIGSETDFTEHIIADNTNRVVRVFAADLDNDGDQDIISGDLAGNLQVYENRRTLNSTAIPKTGDLYDGNEGGEYNFSRDDTLETVTDTLTGLMWQDDAAVAQGSKKWDSLDLENDCKIGVGGYNDWRFPNRHELYYLALKGSTMIDSNFQNMGSMLKDYWTSSPNQIYVHFSSAYDRVAMSINYTRCVRGEPITFDFIRDDNQNVILDNKHKLMWEDGSDSDQRTASSGWDDAKSLCSTLDYLGFDDWRLPNIHELYSIFNDNGLDKAFAHRGSSSDIYISSTTYSASTDEAYGVNASNGLDEQLAKTDAVKFRCVRNIP